MSHLFLWAIAAFLLPVMAQTDELTIVGTWSSKSNAVFTGPGFYDPVDELLIEPALPGISYSFTDDGYWEQATYRVKGNGKTPQCPVAVLQYQHGTYEIQDNGKLVLTPFAVDGRQLLSDPCSDGGVSVYSRYNQTEVFRGYEVLLDDYYGRYRLDLYQHDGSPLPPLYLVYRPPMMLPTITLNPTADPTGGAVKRSLVTRVRRSLENRGKTNAVRKGIISYDFWWWVSIGMIGVGIIGIFFV